MLGLHVTVQTSRSDVRNQHVVAKLPFFGCFYPSLDGVNLEEQSEKAIALQLAVSWPSKQTSTLGEVEKHLG
jgi:hypothetical protein